MRRIGILLALALASVACSILTDLGALQRPDAGPSMDAAPVDDASPDADAQTADAPGGDGEAGTAFDCTGATFCETFDTVKTPDERWTSTFLASGGIIELDPLRYQSPPKGFRAFVPTAGVNVYPSAAIYKDFSATNVKHVKARAAVFVASKDSVDPATIFTLQSNSSPGGGNQPSSFIRVYVPGSGGAVYVHESENNVAMPVYADHTTSVGILFPLGAWTVLVLQLDLVKKELTIQTGSASETFPMVTSFSYPTIELAAGIFYSRATSTPWEVVYDDVRLDLLP